MTTRWLKRWDEMRLELAILSEQKSAKIISFLQEARRSDPQNGNDRDELAEALAKPGDAQDAQVGLDAIRAAEQAEDGVQTAPAASCGAGKQVSWDDWPRSGSRSLRAEV